MEQPLQGTTKNPKKMPVTRHFSLSLTKDSEFDRVMKGGKAVFGPYFTLKTTTGKIPGTPARFGIVISVKTAKRSVDRSKTKRQLNEIIRLARPQCKIGLWSVLIVKPEAIVADYQALEKEFMYLATKAGILQ
ncbi:MAG: ribonuclease P protein component [Patescibacteria group bacterium]